MKIILVTACGCSCTYEIPSEEVKPIISRVLHFRPAGEFQDSMEFPSPASMGPIFRDFRHYRTQVVAGIRVEVYVEKR